MTCANIERFDQITGMVLAHLYTNFPIPSELGSSIIGIQEAHPGIYSPEHGTSIGQEVPSDEERFFFHCIDWLVNTGYITAERPPGNTRFSGAVLTAKGLEVLKAVPDSLTKSSFGEQLQEAAREGMFDTIKELSKEALSRGLGIAASAAMTWTS